MIDKIRTAFKNKVNFPLLLRSFIKVAQEKFQSMDKKEVTGQIKEVIGIVAVFHCIGYYAFNFTLCVGPSMIPTFKKEGNLAIVDLFSYRVRGENYKKGDVVICICPTDPKRRVCKRILGLSGDIVFANNRMSYNDLVRIPLGHVWLAGDNPSNSTDSRSYGPVPMGLIQGRVVYKFDSQFPFIFSVESKIPTHEEEVKDSGKGKRTAKEESEVNIAGSQRQNGPNGETITIYKMKEAQEKVQSEIADHPNSSVEVAKEVTLVAIQQFETPSSSSPSSDNNNTPNSGSNSPSDSR